MFEQAVGRTVLVKTKSPVIPQSFSANQPTPALIEEITATGSMDLTDRARAFRDASNTEIDQGFADAHTFASFMLFAEAAQAMYGKDVGGLASLQALLEDNYDTVGITLLVRQAILIVASFPRTG